jgi:hypothetical protein
VNERVLDKDKLRVIRLQSALVRDGHFFLAGGTGIGLRLGHRLSRDLDWFTPTAFDAEALAARLMALSEQPSELERQGPHTLRAHYGELETSFIRYAQVPARPELVHVAGTEIPVADIGLLAAMKAAAVHDRGTKRDFVDIYTICRLPGWSIGRFIDHATTQLPFQPVQVELALTYFADADREPMPQGFAVPWERVKSELQQGVRAWARQRERGLER